MPRRYPPRVPWGLVGPGDTRPWGAPWGYLRGTPAYLQDTWEFPVCGPGGPRTGSASRDTGAPPGTWGAPPASWGHPTCPKGTSQCSAGDTPGGCPRSTPVDIRGRPEYPEVPSGYPGPNPGVPSEYPQITTGPGEPRGALGYAGVSWATLGGSRVPQDTPRYSGCPQGYPWCPPLRGGRPLGPGRRPPGTQGPPGSRGAPPKHGERPRLQPTWHHYLRKISGVTTAEVTEATGPGGAPL